jgi:Ankyrin repeats (3 copies)/Ankyrin repeat
MKNLSLILFVFFSFNILSVLICHGQELTYPKISGRIVDKSGLPVSDALIDFHPRSENPNSERVQESLDYITVQAKSNNEGTFEVSSFGLKSFSVCVVPPLKEEIFSPLGNFSGCSGFKMPNFRIAEASNVFLGDIPVSFNYQEVELKIRNLDKNSALDNDDSTLWLKVLNDLYYPVTITKIPYNSIKKDVSLIKLNLPEGKWHLEFAYGKEPSQWSASNTLIIPNENKKNFRVNWSLQFPREINPCRENLLPEKAKRELKKLKFDYDNSGFLDAAYYGNEKAMQLFLASDFDPNIISEDGYFALMLSVKFPGVVRMLLKCGSNPNMKTYDGMTPLMSAAVEGELQSVDLLLKNGALLNESDNEGRTALIYAVRNSRTNIVKKLLEFKADTSKKNNSGETAFDIAKSMGLKEITGLLKSNN